MAVTHNMEKKPGTKECILCACIYIMFKSKSNYPMVLEVRTVLTQGTEFLTGRVTEEGFFE